jgi:hypothetical protein
VGPYTKLEAVMLVFNVQGFFQEIT